MAYGNYGSITHAIQQQRSAGRCRCLSRHWAGTCGAVYDCQTRAALFAKISTFDFEQAAMTKTLVKPRTKVRLKTQRPPLYKVILLNDDYTPREFVVLVLKAVFRMNEDQAYRVMMTAHQKGACVIAVYVRDVAETKAKEATDLGKQKGYPLFFTTEPEE
jgi:ATP-dependent Clp protease adaptor protein ClpS